MEIGGNSDRNQAKMGKSCKEMQIITKIEQGVESSDINLARRRNRGEEISTELKQGGGNINGN